MMNLDKNLKGLYKNKSNLLVSYHQTVTDFNIGAISQLKRKNIQSVKEEKKSGGK